MAFTIPNAIFNGWKAAIATVADMGFALSMMILPIPLSFSLLNQTPLMVWFSSFWAIGMFLVVIPWTNIWSQNTLVGRNVALRAFLDLGFVRGALSGLGFINVWIGIWEAVHYRED